MELIKIELENYKSITESIGVEFHKNLPTVLIGKNGSGKSNILEALEHIASTNSNLPGNTVPENYDIKHIFVWIVANLQNYFQTKSIQRKKLYFLLIPLRKMAYISTQLNLKQ